MCHVFFRQSRPDLASLWDVFFYFKSAKAELERLRLGAKRDQGGDGTLKEKASIVAQCLEQKEEKLRNRTRKHRSFNCLEDTEAEVFPGRQKGHKGLKTLRKTEDRNGKDTLDCNNKLPPKVIEELSVVLQRSRTVPKEVQAEQVVQKEIKWLVLQIVFLNIVYSVLNQTISCWVRCV